MPSLNGTRTEKNILTAFAGESQARNRYTYFASQAKKEGFAQISAIFEETANQEKEHAKRLFKMLDLATDIYFERSRKIKTAELNKFFRPIFSQYTPPAVRGKEIKINYVTQINKESPVFIFYCNFPDLIADHYKRFLENKLREKYGFYGIPVVFIFRRK